MVLTTAMSTTIALPILDSKLICVIAYSHDYFLHITIEKDDELKASTNSLEQITKNKQTLAATASSGSEEAKPILTTFEKHYSQDVEVNYNVNLLNFVYF